MVINIPKPGLTGALQLTTGDGCWFGGGVVTGGGLSFGILRVGALLFMRAQTSLEETAPERL